MSTKLATKLWRTVGTRVRDIDDIGDGTDVCIVKSEEAGDVLSNVLAEAARSTGATVTKHEFPSFETWRDSFHLPRAVEEAIRNCDWLLSHPYRTGAQFMWCHSVAGALIDCGINHVAFFGDTESMTSEALMWPDELSSAIAEKLVDDLFSTDREVHVTGDNGTDFRFTGWEEWAHPTPGLEANTFLIYPQAEAGWHPYGTGNGRLVFDAMNRYGMLHEPMEWVVEDGDVVEIRGGDEADHFENWVRNETPGGDAIMLSEVAFGYNPKCRWNTDDPSLAELLFKAGTLHCAVGMSPMKWAPSRTKKTHIDAMMTDPTVHVDGDPILKDGELVLLKEFREDPEIRETAAKYGNPDQLLTSEY